MKKFQSINPFNNQIIGEYKADDIKEVESKLLQSSKSQNFWKNLNIVERASYLDAYTKKLLERKSILAEMAAKEMGKPIQQGVAEVEKCAVSILYYIKNAQKFLEEITIPTEAQKSYVSLQPLGVILAIMPWNFPYWQVCRAMGPILMSGNSMVLKHASNVMGCAQLLKECWDDAGLPADCFQLINVAGADMESVISNKYIHAITFTGSTEAGAKVASIAGKYLKKQVLELGGSDAYIILEDADLKLAAQKCTQSRLNNSGQSCIAAKRFIVLDNIADEFTRLLVDEFSKYKLGDPLLPDTTIGPQARQDLRDQLHDQVTLSLEKGAKKIIGGDIPEGDHALYPPTILDHVSKGMPAYDEEMFGPVASIIRVSTIEEAISIANDSIYGLGGGIFTKQINLAEEIATKRLETGFVAINDFVSSDPRLPFGGIKQSGYGRELSHFGLLEFCNIKTIFVR